ncbi:hypothetical protein FACS18942_08080 [Planctomycetales bacterium]|nr:hypothetical protein FACS18942_08080 [Planctomycetales bacterium]GHT38276.1 hypothetical protein FACS189427_12270 [Planctomycetales bacterium]
MFTPQFILMLGIYPADTPLGTVPATLDGFFAAGCNYAGGGDIKGDYGKVIGSSLKFKLTGQVKIGTAEVGSIDYQLYTAQPTP